MTTALVPRNFPIPPDVEGFWAWEKGHFPRPATPLTQEFLYRAISDGFSAAMETWACPFGAQCRAINYYGFFTIKPFNLGSETMPERVARYQDVLGQVLPRMGELWEQTWLPAILPGLEKGRTTDYGALSDEELLHTLDEMRREFLERWTIHGWINFVTISASWFADFYNETFEPEDPTEPYLLLQGFPTRSLAAGRGLWRLSRMIKNTPALKRVFEEQDPAQLVSHLERLEEGRHFMAEFRPFLDEFGWRSDAFELADPTWRENPRIPLNTLQGYISLGEEADPDLRFQEAVRTRERLLAQARQRLAGDLVKQAGFNELYEMGCHNLVLTEDHNFYIDQMGDSILRPPLLELGRRLVRRGALADQNDVFLLYLVEIRAGLSGESQQVLVAQRKAEMEAWSRIIPPPTIGEPPPPSNDPWEEAILRKMLGVPVEPSRDPNVITGIGASPGTVQSRATVVHNLSEASKVQSGDILVCEMTMPAWTPLFSTASAVISDTGGVLSHCAIVSREYRIPCVVGTVVGTTLLKDGMLLTVDGSRGIVRIDSRV
jgi:phosphohistidine swiveling domain-containing protein